MNSQASYADQSNLLPSALLTALDNAGKVAATAAVYRDRPAEFVLECIRWPEGQHPTAYQLDNLRKLVEHKRLAVRGCHGLGKTGCNAWAILWFALTRDAVGDDWKIPTTASAWRQLEKYLWPEVHKWARLLDWEKLGRDPFNEQTELMRLSLRLNSGEAFAVACEDPASIEGAHADQILYIYDESKTIGADTFDASEGAFSGAGADTGQDAYALASSTPGEPQGRFYEICVHKPGLEDWHTAYVKLDQVIEAGRVSREWANQRIRQWGRDSAVTLNRVFGEFASSEEDGVIPLSWVEEANERWLALEGAGWPELGNLSGLGADIARSGKDKTVLAMRYGHVIHELRRLPKGDTMETTGHIAGVLTGVREGHPWAVVDVIGIGAGVVDRLRELGHDVRPFNASESSKLTDKSGELGMVNCRSAALWNLRDMLDPSNEFGLALPPDDKLTGDLIAPKWRVISGGKVQIESKDEIRKRLGRSPDDGDAVAMAYFVDATVSVHAPIFGFGESRWAPMRQDIGMGGGGMFG